jgi:ethanolamine utilization cobalamin adenosyltransferase
LDEAQLRQHSHFPQKYYGVPHFMPSCQDKDSVLCLNKVRCFARQAELLAADAFCDREGVPTRTDILQALNRLSSMIYILMIREKE